MSELLLMFKQDSDQEENPNFEETLLLNFSYSTKEGLEWLVMNDSTLDDLVFFKYYYAHKNSTH